MRDPDEPLNILVLHRLGDPLAAPDFLVKHTHLLRNYHPENNYLYHDVSLPIPEFVREEYFDAILLDVTLLCIRWAEDELFQEIISALDFVRHSSALKIAFPQDEYDCHLKLDNWMCSWNVDILYTVLPDHVSALYPQFSRQRTLRKAFTGYLDDKLFKAEPAGYNARPIDIGYRARKLPPYFGRIGQNKWTIAEGVRQKALQEGLTLDIAVGERSSLPGQSWLDFINRCKFTLGANSGSSLLDPYGDIQRKVKSYVAVHPEATFDEVERTCFPGLDGLHSMTAISPRNLEAGMFESCQLLVEGAYSGILEPHQHYIPLTADASNFSDVLKIMRNRHEVDCIRKRCRNRLLDYEPLRASWHAREIIQTVRDEAKPDRPSDASDKGRQASVRYKSAMHRDYEHLWRRQRIKKTIRGFFPYESPTIAFLRRLTRRS